jgi:glycosyltransferase involved in cell wall biosynthesis
MKINFVLPTADFSGGIRVVAMLATQLERLGHQVTLVSPPPPTPSLREKLRSLARGKGWSAEGPRASHLDGAGLVHRVLERNRPVADEDVPDGDVVIGTWWHAVEWVDALDGRKGAKVNFIQGYEPMYYVPLDRCEATYRFRMHKIVVSGYLGRMIAEKFGNEPIDVVPNSVDRAQFFAPERGKQSVPTIGFVYASFGLKGVDVALAAIEVIRQRMGNVRVIAFGTERPSPTLPLPDYVEMNVSPPQARLREFYARCDVWLSASPGIIRRDDCAMPTMRHSVFRGGRPNSLLRRRLDPRGHTGDYGSRKRIDSPP